MYSEYLPYFRWFAVSKDGWKKMANLLEEGYRMPKPQHVDEKLYEKIVLLLVLLLFFYVLITVTFIFKVLLMKVACVAQN